MLGTYLLYNSILIFSTLFVYLYEKEKNIVFSYVFLCVAFLIVFIPAAIRYNIGADYFGYIDIYNAYQHSGELKQEIGLKFILDFLIYFKLPAHSFIVLSSFVVYSLLFLSYPKQGATIYHFAYMVVFYLISYNLIRSAIVLSLCFVFLKLFIDSKYKLIQILVLIIAFSFHKTALLIIFPLFLIWVGFDRLLQFRGFLLLFLLITIVSFYMRDYLISAIISSGIIDFIGYDHYLDSSYFKEVKFNTGLGSLLKVSILFLSIYYSGNINEKYRSLVVVSSVLLIYAVILQSSIEIFARVQRFYIFGFVFSLVGFYLSAKFRMRRVIILYSVIWGLLFFEMDIGMMRSDICDGSRISPYVSIFNKLDDKSWSGIIHGECINW